MDLLRYTRIAIYTGLFLIPFSALIVADNLYFPFITGKNFYFRILVEIVFALWVFLALYDVSARPKQALAYMLGGLFVLAIGVSTLLAENPLKAFWSNFERMDGYITILHLAAYVMVLTTVLRTEVMWRRFFNVTLGVSVLVGIYALFQLGGAFTINQGGVRVDGTLGNATYFAVYMMVHAFLALYAAFRYTDKTKWLVYIYGAIFVLDAVLVFYSATRGSILGLVGGLFLAGLIFLLMGGAGYARKAGIAVIAIVLVLTGAFFTIKDTDFVRTHPVLERIASISLSEMDTRFTIWGMAYQGVVERPIFGWGQEGFNFLFNKYYESKLYKQEPWFDRAHNVFIDWLVAGGIVGALLYISLYVVLLYYLWRPGNTFDVSERAILTGLIAAYAFHNMLVFDNLLSYVLFFAIFSYITYRATDNAPATAGEPLAESTMPLAAPVVLVGLFVILYLANGPGYRTASDIISGLTPQTEGVQRNLQYFVDAAARGGLGNQEVGEQFLQFAVQVRTRNIGDQQFQINSAQAARAAFEGVLADAPGDARLLVFFGSFLRQFGDNAAAREYLERALAESPQKQSILLEIGVLDYAEGKFDDALKKFEEIYTATPDFQHIGDYYASAAIASGDQALATKILTEKYGTDEPINSTVLQAYLAKGSFAKAIRIAEKLAVESPTTDSYKVLAGVYLQARQTARAVEVLRTAIEKDPSFKLEGESYIKDIQGTP